MVTNEFEQQEATVRIEVLPAAYAHPIDAIVLAGTHQNPKRLINDHNKAFLEIAGRPLVRHVVDALRAAAHIGRIFVVGPREELGAALTGLPDVTCVQQEGKMLSNSWAGIRAAESLYPHLDARQVHRRPLLIVSSDLPLISPASVDDFVIRCAALDRETGIEHAMLSGIAEDADLSPFYGRDGKPGIFRPLVQLNEGQMRLANIYVVRPRHLAHSEFLQTSFSLRKAKDWRNVMKLVLSLFRQHGGWEAAWVTVRLQLAAMLRKGQGRLYRNLRAGNTIERVEKGVSTVLGGPVRMVVTPFGGLSLDVDEEEDYRVLANRYADWMRVVRGIERGLGFS